MPITELNIFGSLASKDLTPLLSGIGSEAPLGAEDRRVSEAVDQRFAGRPSNHTFSTHFDSLDTSACELLLQTAPNRLNLGQLGHRSGQGSSSERSGRLLGGLFRPTGPCAKNIAIDEYFSTETLRVIGAR